jgi:ribosome silencing factor RsfS/YbeB/iojap
VRKRAAPKLAPGVPASPGTPRKKAAAAGPKKEAERLRERAAPSRLDQLQTIILTSLDEDKAENIVALDLAGRASFADRMVIATGVADRQITAMATHLEDKLEEAGLKRIQIEGSGGSDWVLIDAGDIIIHLFKAEAREMYALERMWGPELDEPAAETDEAAAEPDEASSEPEDAEPAV